MRILFEEHKYPVSSVRDIVSGIVAGVDLNKKSTIKLTRVGYFFNPALDDGKGDIVFILPKVFLDPIKDEQTDKVKEWKVFGTDPEDLIEFDWKKWKSGAEKDDVVYDYNVKTKDSSGEETQKQLRKKDVADFLFQFSLWVYRAICVYDDRKRKKKVKEDLEEEETFINSGLHLQKGFGTTTYTLLDVLLSIQDYNKKNQDFITFTIKNLHSGYNKISWNKTISKIQPIIQDNTPIYMKMVNKKRVINFDEDLLIIYYSIINHMNEEYGFHERIAYGYELITGARFRNYIKGQGKVHLLKIRHKFFSDKALQMWNLCYAFFDKQHKLRTSQVITDDLLINKFETVFEDMIDCMLGDSDLPHGLKKQGDDKRIDHLYTYNDLMNSTDQDKIYFIGDSKYYMQNDPTKGHDDPKQYTYARNVIQWHFDLLNGVLEEPKKKKDKDKFETDKQKYSSLPLFDPITEGYNIIPNFFISGVADKGLNFDIDNLDYADRNSNKEVLKRQWQFEDRLFDRSTLFLSHYDVNFLFILKRYAQNRPSLIEGWKQNARKEFRDNIIKLLKDEFVLYQVCLPESENIESFVHRHFYELHGRVFSFKHDNENKSILLYAEPSEIADGKSIQEQNAERSKNTCNNKSLVKEVGNGHELVLDGGKVRVKLIKVDLGNDIEKVTGYTVKTTADLNTLVKGTLTDTATSIKKYTDENEISVKPRRDGVTYTYELPIDAIVNAAEEQESFAKIPSSKDLNASEQQTENESDTYYQIKDDIEENEKFTKYLPLYSIRAACGAFNHGDLEEQEGWVDVTEYGIKPNNKMFIVHAEGDSMEDEIHDGDLCVFTRDMGGSREGKIVLVESNNTDCRHVIKEYHSTKVQTEDGWAHDSITLHSLNPEYEDIHLTDEDEPMIVGIYVDVLEQ